MAPVRMRAGVSVTAVMLSATSVLAATQTVDFDGYAVGTVITNQYPGVVFSAVPQSCGGTPKVNLVIYTPTGGTSSGSRALGITTGCPDFSPDYIRMVFDQLQSEVTFTLGETAETFRVRAYSTASGGTAISTQTIAIEGTGYVGVHRAVRVLSATGNIKRIEVESIVGNFECIDDLTFACPNTTPPEVYISSPAYGACLCGGSVLFSGVSCDAEGFDHDTLEYLPVNAPAGTAWTTVDSASVPQCPPAGPLYYWNVSAVPEGTYYVRITSTNSCGLQSSAVTLVHVDQTPDAPAVRSPAEAAIVGGVVPVDGTASDGPNGGCFGSYQVEYTTAAGITWYPVNPAMPVYAAIVLNDPLAYWDTRNVSPTVKDGAWRLRAQTTNTCGEASAAVIRNVVVDNTAPVVLITQPLNCQAVDGLVTIRGTVSDPHLGSWRLQYTGGDAHGWVEPPIATSDAPVSNGILGTWNTAGLRRCAYTLRLVASDTAIVDGIGSKHNQSEYMVCVYLGPVGHFDYDGDGDVDLTDYGVFQRCFSGPGVAAPLDCRD